jgi:uncharacterized protein (DUF58 family)
MFRSAGAMYPLIFAILWTGLSAVLILSTLDQLQPWERGVALLFPLVGLFVVHATWLRWRRRRSLRVEEDDGATCYLWVEIDGSTRRSKKDPRDDWDSEGGDGDGDGGGD